MDKPRIKFEKDKDGILPLGRLTAKNYKDAKARTGISNESIEQITDMVVKTVEEYEETCDAMNITPTLGGFKHFLRTVKENALKN